MHDSQRSSKRKRRPTDRAYTWFNRRAPSLDAARVDYFLVSDNIASCVRASDILGLLPWRDYAPVRLEIGAGDAN